jgi:hypothetical protein
MRKVRVLLVIRSLVLVVPMRIDVGDVGGSVALFILLIRIFSVLFKDIFLKITPICAASWAFACICSRGGKVSRARAFSALYA